MSQPMVLLRALALAGVVSPLAASAATVPIKLPKETAQLRMSAMAGHGLAVQKCGICHSADYVAYQPPGMTLTQWTAEVAKMQHAYGAPIDPADVAQIGAYLAVAYGSTNATDPAVVRIAVAAAAPAQAPTDVQGLLARNGCLGCHSVTQRVVGPAYKDVAAKYLNDPLAQNKLEASIWQGSAGKWGPAAMPPFPGLSSGDLKVLAEFVRAQR